MTFSSTCPSCSRTYCWVREANGVKLEEMFLPKSEILLKSMVVVVVVVAEGI